MTDRATQPRPTAWTLAWLLWLAWFLAVELPGVAAKKVGSSFSEHCWRRWFPTKWHRLAPCVFLLELVAHIWDGGQHVWSGGLAIGGLAVPVVVIVLYREVFVWRSAVALGEGAVGVLADVKRLMVLRDVRDRLRDARAAGQIKLAVFALLGAVVSGAVAQVTGACPGLIAAAPAIATASIGGAITFLMRRPLEKRGVKVLASGAAGAFVAVALAQLQAVCGEGFVEKLPALLTAGAWVGLGLWLRAPHEAQ